MFIQFLLKTMKTRLCCILLCRVLCCTLNTKPETKGLLSKSKLDCVVFYFVVCYVAPWTLYQKPKVFSCKLFVSVFIKNNEIIMMDIYSVKIVVVSSKENICRMNLHVRNYSDEGSTTQFF